MCSCSVISFQHADAAMVEMYGREIGGSVSAYWESTDPSRHSGGVTTYLQQLAGAGRTGVAAKLFNLTVCTDGDWMYNRPWDKNRNKRKQCLLDLDIQALIHVIEKWVPKPAEWQSRSKQLKEAKILSRTSRAGVLGFIRSFLG